MTSSAKRKGDRAEREAVELLREHLGLLIRRRFGAGQREDLGDVAGIDNVVVQVADWADVLRAVREKPLEAEFQRERAGATFAATLVRMRGGVWRIVLTPEQFAVLLREALADVPCSGESL